MRKKQLEQVEKELSSVQEEDINPGEIVLRPDGYHWVALDGRQEFGPFETRDQAMSDRDASDEERLSPGESLQEAEDEIGIAAWIDPETGEPAEGLSHPRLEE